jgi:hypothetical protein
MRHGHDHPDIKAFFTNLQAPMPLYRKVWLLFRNNLKKIMTMRSCCGHPGEPGC